MTGAPLGFAAWMCKDGTDLWAAAAFALGAYGDALAELLSPSSEGRGWTPGNCHAVDELHQAALTLTKRFYGEAVRRLKPGGKGQ